MTETIVVTPIDERPIPDGAWREVALRDDEYQLILTGLHRQPTMVELGMFGAMWSEHCGYKHSRRLLQQLPTDAPWVLQGPGENAGAIDIGDGLAVVFKVESHNHPSAVEPYQGAATGVGGIVRDIFSMGARPIALLDSLRFGPLDKPRNHYLFNNVVAGIGGYGNCLGIPTVGGDLFFDSSYSTNPLVNAMCVGIVTHADLMRASASGTGNAILILGAETGRDGLHGATFSSVENPTASHRGVIQVGNPFLEKLLLEACLSLLSEGSVVAMQDLGAAGLTSAVVECASRGSVGAEINVAMVPRREADMTPYEVMLSESQERMLLVVTPDGVERIQTIATWWGLTATVIGQVIAEEQIRILDHGRIVALVPTTLLTEHCPTYDLSIETAPRREDHHRPAHDGIADVTIDDSQGSANQALRRLLASPNVGTRRSIWEQYDHTILANTVAGPGDADAAVLRLRNTTRGIAVAMDCNSRFCLVDGDVGTQHAVAEAARNVSCVGATPLAVTNCLNFGNPENPTSASQLVAAVNGLSTACRALGLPVVSGNVSLYNESLGASVLPTPVIGIVGLLEDVTKHSTLRWSDGDVIVLIGHSPGGIGATEYLEQIHGHVTGKPPDLDLGLETRVQEVARRSIELGWVRTAHDTSLGGIGVALAKLAIASSVGAIVDVPLPAGPHQRVDEALFGEAGSRVIVACRLEQVVDIERLGTEHDVPVTRLGQVTGDRLVIQSWIDLSITDLREADESALPG